MTEMLTRNALHYYGARNQWEGDKRRVALLTYDPSTPVASMRYTASTLHCNQLVSGRERPQCLLAPLAAM